MHVRPDYEPPPPQSRREALARWIAEEPVSFTGVLCGLAAGVAAIGSVLLLSPELLIVAAVLGGAALLMA